MVRPPRSPAAFPFSVRVVSLIVLLLTLWVRAAWLQRYPADPLEPVDAEGYHLIAVNVLAGRGFAIGWDPPFCPTAVRTPLYPAFLMLAYQVLGPEPDRAVLLQLLLELLTAALVIRIVRDLRPADTRAQVLAGLLYALNGTTQRYTGYLLTESLLLPAFSAAVLLTLRCLRHPRRPGPAPILERTRLPCALLWAAVLLIKPNLQILALLVGGMVTARYLSSAGPRWRRAWAGVGAFWLAFLLPLLPWIVRNRLVMDRWLLSSAFEENLAHVSVVALRAQLTDTPAEPWSETWEHLYRQFTTEVGRRFGWDASTSLGVSCAALRRRQAQITAVAREELLRWPFHYARAHLRGVLWSVLDPGHRTWYPVLTGLSWESTGVAGRLEQRLLWSLRRGAVGDALHAFWLERVVLPPREAVLTWWVLAILRVAVWGIALLGLHWLRRNPWDIAVLAGAIASILLLPGPIAYDRFYLPAIPLVAALLGLGAPITRHNKIPLPLHSRKLAL